MEDTPSTLDDVTASVQLVQPVASTSARPDAHSQRYDRQLRLWGSSGQSGLEAASILVVSGSATATQVLKNLVLPGIGSFTILDPCMTTPADIGNNFFLEDSSLGHPRAAEAVKHLLELNEGVRGHAIVEDVPTFLNRAPSAVSAYTLVISVDQPPASTNALAERCWAENVPLILARSCGFIVSFAVQVAEVAHIETHPPNTIDLRLDRPFSSLLEYANSMDLDSMDSHDYGHVPSVVIVIRALEEWKATHNGQLPSNFKERKELGCMILSQKRQQDDENFDEAVALVKNLARPTEIPPDIQTLFDDPACQAATSPDSPPFWLLVHALRNFSIAQKPPTLPLSGSLPDMKATSAGFHALSGLYRAKAREDMASVRRELSNFGLPPDHIVHKELDTFVKHAAYLHHSRGVPYAQIGKGKQSHLSLEGQEEEAELAGIFVALLATELFAVEAGRWPGSAGPGHEDVDKDMSKLQDCAYTVLERLGRAKLPLPEAVLSGMQEIARSGGADLPQMAALNGGMIAQEAIKLVTRQYLPVNGMVIFDGVKSRSATFV